MTGILTFIAGYLILLVAWFLLAVLLLAISYIIKKNLLLGTYIITTGMGFLISIGVLIWAVQLFFSFLTNKEWLLLVLFIIFGSWLIGMYQAIYGLLLTPFHAISEYFVNKTASILESNQDIYEADVLSPEGKTINKTFSEGKINWELATWLLVSFGSVTGRGFLMNSTDLPVIWVFLINFIVIVLGAFVMALILAIFNLVRSKPAFDYDKRVFVAKCMRAFSIVYLIMFGLEIISIL